MVMKHTIEELAEILRLHADWRMGREGGVRADLTDANLAWANLAGANLTWANLAGADLTEANLTGANLTGAMGLTALCGSYYLGFIYRDRLRIGCEDHPISEWRGFTDDRIDTMDGDALEWWTDNKSWVFGACDAHIKRWPYAEG